MEGFGPVGWLTLLGVRLWPSDCVTNINQAVAPEFGVWGARFGLNGLCCY